MLPYLNLGPIGLPTAPLVYLFGMWLVLYAVDRAARRQGQEPEPLYALASAALLAGFVGARLTFVLVHWSSFDDNLLGIIWPLTSGYSAGRESSLARRRRFSWPLASPLSLAHTTLVPGLIVFLMAASLADFSAARATARDVHAVGASTSSACDVTRCSCMRWGRVGGAGAWWTATSPRYRGANGRPFLLAVVVYSAGRLFVDAFKETTPTDDQWHPCGSRWLPWCLLFWDWSCWRDRLRKEQRVRRASRPAPPSESAVPGSSFGSIPSD